MTDVNWPQREAFFAHLDELKAAAGIAYDSALAERVGLSPPAVEHWRDGRRMPSLGQVQAIAAAFGESEAYLAALAGLITVPGSGEDSVGPAH